MDATVVLGQQGWLVIPAEIRKALPGADKVAEALAEEFRRPSLGPI